MLRSMKIEKIWGGDMAGLELTISDWMIVTATLLGPILAVQAQKWIERSRESRARKLQVFHTLMATRGARLSADHVRGLNMIDLSFYGSVRLGRRWTSSRDQSVLNAWKEYHDHLSDSSNLNLSMEALWVQRDELFVNLLFAMGRSLGYQFDRVQLKKSWYSPNAHVQNEVRMDNLVTAATGVLEGRTPIQIVPGKLERPSGDANATTP
ncbi:DUF6680 family protein [Pseudomonas vancouverensis]|uniref:DUF6680 domain-containing protein n=1 Tax=Pseudomonas vancouverensis TaxID=95300 RepID=A0A1H2MW87_PSEVA|nr:DUF6680 family protein [Pseudomonas vancouverensis]KAB0489673.1 hypothetical protein F7R09_28555 [Pseudomonas vancouverensis]TDB67169.1 hypothetical protein EIY72_03725 [Pseudomonas vancouverensis]SDU97195.1 hypothetical protein SAMN05216558_1331 [Pseudomonas vancouverensis]